MFGRKRDREEDLKCRKTIVIWLAANSGLKPEEEVHTGVLHTQRMA